MKYHKFLSIFTITFFLFLTLIFSAWLSFSWNNLDYLQFKSLDEYAFHGVLLKFHESILNLDIRSFFSFSFFSYGFLFFFVNYLVTFPFIATESTELVIFLPKLINTIFFLLAIFLVDLILQLLKAHYLYRGLSFLLILSMPGIWINVNWFHPDFMMIALLMLSIYFLILNKFELKNFYDPSIVFWSIAIAIKIQAITFAPIYLWLWGSSFSSSQRGIFSILQSIKVIMLILLIYILCNPYLLNPDGFNAWIASQLAEVSNSAANQNNLTLLSKMQFGIFNYYLPFLTYIVALVFSIYLVGLDIIKKDFSIKGALGITYFLNCLYLMLLMNKGWNHYYLPIIFLLPLIIFMFFKYTKLNFRKQILFFSLIVVSQGYVFAPQLIKIVEDRIDGKVVSRDSIHDYEPIEYTLNELKKNNESLNIFFEKKIDSTSHILSSAYLGFPFSKLDIPYDQVRTIYGPVSQSDIDWFRNDIGSNNYIFIKKNDYEMILNAFFKSSIRLKILYEINCCYLIKTFEN